MKNIFLFLCVLLMCACNSINPVSDIEGEYLLSAKWTTYINGVEDLTHIWRPDSAFRYKNNELLWAKKSEEWYHNPRTLTIFKDNGVSYVTNTIIGEPDTLLQIIDGKFIGKRNMPMVTDGVEPMSCSKHVHFWENGLIICHYNGIRHFQSLQTKIVERKNNSLVLAKSNPFECGYYDEYENFIGYLNVQYNYDPIVVNGNRISWHAEYFSEITGGSGDIRVVFDITGVKK